MRCQDCGQLEPTAGFTNNSKAHPCGPLCTDCMVKRKIEQRKREERNR